MGELGADTDITEVYLDGDRLITLRLDSNQTSVKPLNDKDGARTIAQLQPLGFPQKRSDQNLLSSGRTTVFANHS